MYVGYQTSRLRSNVFRLGWGDHIDAVCLSVIQSSDGVGELVISILAACVIQSLLLHSSITRQCHYIVALLGNATTLLCNVITGWSCFTLTAFAAVIVDNGVLGFVFSQWVRPFARCIEVIHRLRRRKQGVDRVG